MSRLVEIVKIDGMDKALSDLYQDVILDHNRHPRNKRTIEHPTAISQGYNPSCGDDITVFVKLDNGVIKEVTFAGEGCAISQASASLMTGILVGKTVVEAKRIIDQFFDILSERMTDGNPDDFMKKYGEACALLGVKKFPMRIKCATLAWHAASDAISNTAQHECCSN